MISPGYFNDQFLDTFGPVVYVLEHCGIYFSVFLFIKLIIGVVVMIVRYMEIDKITGSTLGFDKTLLSASYNIFLTSVLTSMYNPRVPAITAVEHLEIGPCVKNDIHELNEDAKKIEEHLYPAMSIVTLPLSRVQKIFRLLIFWCLVLQSMESGDSLPVLTVVELYFPTLTSLTLGQPIEPVVTFLSPPSTTIPSNPASPDAQPDTISTT